MFAISPQTEAWYASTNGGQKSKISLLLFFNFFFQFIFDLMVCGKGNDNQPLQEFILQSPAPIDTAVKLSSLYREMSEKEKERAKDLVNF